MRSFGQWAGPVGCPTANLAPPGGNGQSILVGRRWGNSGSSSLWPSKVETAWWRGGWHAICRRWKLPWPFLQGQRIQVERMTHVPHCVLVPDIGASSGSFGEQRWHYETVICMREPIDWKRLVLSFTVVINCYSWLSNRPLIFKCIKICVFFFYSLKLELIFLV